MNSGAPSGGQTGKQPDTALLSDRYQIVRELSRHSMGQTYLAEDLHRDKELCVIKEFIPQLENTATLSQARELFEHEANTLYQLSHKQIPEFCQLLQTETKTGGRLFSVQDYVEGSTYKQLLQARQNFGGRFNETEITQLLYQLLPVLSYIHGLGVIHQNISPENIIARRDDGLPVLIDFGSVKAIAADIRSQLSINDGEGNDGEGDISRIGATTYAAPEQQNNSSASPTTDLYSLAATLLVLANGQDPQTLYDMFSSSWTGFDALSPKLGAILEKMLQPEPANRFQTAGEVLEALSSSANFSASEPAVSNSALYPSVGPSISSSVGPTDPISTAPEDVFNEQIRSTATAYEEATVVPISEVSGYITEPEQVSSTYETTLAEANVHEPVIAKDKEKQDRWQALIPLLFMIGTLGAVLLAWLFFRRPAAQTIAESPGQNMTQTASNTGEFSLEETGRRREISDRKENLELGDRTFNNLVEQLFYAKYPALLTSGPNESRQEITTAAEDEPLRVRWDELSLGLLSTFENDFSDRSLQGLGSYSESDRARWQNEVNSADIGTRALYDIADAKFLALFPEQAGRDFLDRPIGQVYYAIADDTANAIANRTLLTPIDFTTNRRQEFDRRLPPGAGRIYLLDLTAGQNLRLSVSAEPSSSTLISLYLPDTNTSTPSIFNDSEQTTWSGNIAQSGTYKLVIVNTADAPIDYQLAVSVDSVTTAPPIAPEREELPSIPEDSASEEDRETSDSGSADAASEQRNENMGSTESEDNNNSSDTTE